MSAETASSSDVASVENGTAVQQNFTPPVSKSALFDNIVEEEGAERERFVIHLFLLFDIQLRCIRSFSAWWFREARIGAAYVPLYEVVRGNNKKVKSSFM